MVLCRATHVEVQSNHSLRNDSLGRQALAELDYLEPSFGLVLRSPDFRAGSHHRLPAYEPVSFWEHLRPNGPCLLGYQR